MAAANFPDSPTPNVTTYVVGGITYLYVGGDKWEVISQDDGDVQSVTGDGVDNTDPLNPVLSFPGFTDLPDTPSSYTLKAGFVPAVNTGETALGFIPSATITPSTVEDFTDLEDVPTSYSSKADHVVAVKSAEDGLEFVPTIDVSNYFPVGVQDKYIGAVDMFPTTTAGCASLAITEVSPVNIRTLDFDDSTEENAQIVFSFPRNWDRGTISLKVYWTAASGTGGVAWGVKGLALSDDDPLNGTFGTEVIVTDTLITANDFHVTDYTSSITINGSPLDGDIIVLNIARKTGNASDTLNADAKLIGVSIRYVLDAAVAE
jgi:hypothetical protein